ncbi:J domain-containing protein [Natronomonas sp. EA1]|uniref:J domain-containing protein n=1 Tax=Natronomonas sp. EA1 TaxID=3421655 RepID=UPI003EBB1EBB
MDRSRLVVGLAAVFAGMTVFLVVLAAVLREVVVLGVALPFGAATYLFWYHASGRIREGIHERARRQAAAREARERESGGFGAGPREQWERAGRRARAGGQRTRQRTRKRVQPNPGPSREQAYRTLGLSPGADEEAVKSAYREKVKETHPDRGGSEEQFKKVTRAYDRLS